MPIILPKSDKTEVYSFRTTEKMMTNLKNYAKAINTTLPNAINKVLEDNFKGKTLTREINQNIRIPVHKQLTSQEIEKLNSTEKAWFNNPKYIRHENKWFEICLKIIAYYNNYLDVWKEDTYKSDNEKLKHEGLYIYKVIDRINYIKINQYLDYEYFAYIISKKEAVELAEKSNNMKLIETIEKNEGMNRIIVKGGFVELEDYEKVKSENIKLQEKLNQMELLLKN